MQPGIHLVHKPVGATSFSLVRAAMAEIQRLGLTRQLPVVHGGALDPFAEGLMLLLVGQATRLMELVHAAPKSYVATIAWGAETDTGDPGGRIMARGDASTLSMAALEEALAARLGWREQVPPATSNKRVSGERAYKKAHRGEAVELAPVRVYLHQARWTSTSGLELCCRGGYYVRALVRDLGRDVGVPAHLASLRRTSIGPWADPAAGVDTWIRGEALVPWLPSRALTDDEQIAVEQGRAIARGAISPPEFTLPDYPMPEVPIRALHAGRLVALLQPKGALLEVEAELRGGL